MILSFLKGCEKNIPDRVLKASMKDLQSNIGELVADTVISCFATILLAGNLHQVDELPIP